MKCVDGVTAGLFLCETSPASSTMDTLFVLTVAGH